MQNQSAIHWDILDERENGGETGGGGALQLLGPCKQVVVMYQSRIAGSCRAVPCLVMRLKYSELMPYIGSSCHSFVTCI